MRLQEEADGRAGEAELEREYQRELFRWAAREVRGEFAQTTWLAFWHTAVEGLSIPAVAAELGKTVGAVYIARSRVMQRLRDKVAEYEIQTDDPTMIRGFPEQ